MRAIIVEVTCERCGQSWRRREAAAEQRLDCVFCGSPGRLQMGARPPDEEGLGRVVAWLRCERPPQG